MPNSDLLLSGREVVEVLRYVVLQPDLTLLHQRMVAATVNCSEMDWNRNMEFFAIGVFVSGLAAPYFRSNMSLPSWSYLASVERARRASRLHSASRTAAGVRQGTN